MTDNDRAALCGYEYQNTDVPADRNFLADLHGPDGMVSYADVLRLLAERHGEPTVPDAERVERAADAIHDVDRKRFPDAVRHIPSRTVYLDRARAALAAVHADIAARALSDEVLDAMTVAAYEYMAKFWNGYDDYEPQPLSEPDLNEARATRRSQATALLLALGITESEEEGCVTKEPPSIPLK